MARSRRLTPAPVRPPERLTPSSVVEYVRPDIRALAGYAPGEQQADTAIKLNTNECAYEPSPRTRAALEAGGPRSLRLYPDPQSRRLREVAARRFGVRPEQILAGNGSDDCLTILYRTFLAHGARAACPWPTYGLYDTLAGIQGVNILHTDYERTSTAWGLPDALGTSGARLTLISNPNNPSSTLTPVAELRRLAERLDGILVVDEAYVDFALPDVPDASMLPHLDAHSNLVVLRTFSKSYSLAGARLGLMFAGASLVEEMNKVKDSYNVNALTQAVGIAALEDEAHHADLVARTLRDKADLERALAALGWSWPEARGNFLLCEVGDRAPEIHAALRARKILVRHWPTPELRTSLRISVGTTDQHQALVTALREIL